MKRKKIRRKNLRRIGKGRSVGGTERWIGEIKFKGFKIVGEVEGRTFGGFHNLLHSVKESGRKTDFWSINLEYEAKNE
jgi:hypothetical protein